MSTPDMSGSSRPSPSGGGPVDTALGLLAVGTRELIKLPFTVLRFQVQTVHRTLVAAEAVRHSFEELASLGMSVVSALRPGAPPDRTPAPTAPTEPTATKRPAPPAAAATEPPGAFADFAPVGEADVEATSDGRVDAALAPEVEPEPAGFAPAPVTADDDRVDIVTRAAEAAEVAAHDPELPVVDRETLPIVDFDHVTAGSLRGRLRRLDVAELRVLRMYEQEHARRLPILTLLENRIAKLEAEGA